MKDFFSVDELAESTFQGRVAQGRRELAVHLHRDVTFGQLAEAAGVSGPAMSDWMKGKLPTRENMKALAGVFLKAGLTRYTDIYLERGNDRPGDNGYDIEPATEPIPKPGNGGRKRA